MRFVSTVAPREILTDSFLRVPTGGYTYGEDGFQTYGGAAVVRPGIRPRRYRYGRKLLNEIKAHFGKESYQFITTDEFAEYSGIKEEIINQYLEKVS